MKKRFFHWLETAFGIQSKEYALVQSFFIFFVGIGMLYTVGVTVGDTLFLSSLPTEQVPRILPFVYIVKPNTSSKAPILIRFCT